MQHNVYTIKNLSFELIQFYLNCSICLDAGNIFFSFIWEKF